MANFKDDILEALEDNKERPSDIIAVRIDDLIDSYRYSSGNLDTRDMSVEPFLKQLLSWAVAEKLFDYKYNTGFGRQDCHNFCLWTKDHVYFIHEYDGSTTVISVDRNPVVG